MSSDSSRQSIRHLESFRFVHMTDDDHAKHFNIWNVFKCGVGPMVIFNHVVGLLYKFKKLFLLLVSTCTFICSNSMVHCRNLPSCLYHHFGRLSAVDFTCISVKITYLYSTDLSDLTRPIQSRVDLKTLILNLWFVIILTILKNRFNVVQICLQHNISRFILWTRKRHGLNCVVDFEEAN